MSPLLHPSVPIIHILGFLDTVSLARTAATCRAMREACAEQSLWQHLSFPEGFKDAEAVRRLCARSGNKLKSVDLIHAQLDEHVDGIVDAVAHTRCLLRVEHARWQHVEMLPHRLTAAHLRVPDVRRACHALARCTLYHTLLVDDILSDQAHLPELAAAIDSRLRTCSRMHLAAGAASARLIEAAYFNEDFARLLARFAEVHLIVYGASHGKISTLFLNFCGNIKASGHAFVESDVRNARYVQLTSNRLFS